MAVKSPTKEEALLKMASLCARSEQCSYDIKRKLLAKGLSPNDAEYVLEQLRDRRFLDDSRFAKSFANDKVRFASWGRIKIRVALKAKWLSDSCVNAALADIDPDDYDAALTRVARSKASSLNLSLREDRAKLWRYLLSRGFESDRAMSELKRLLQESHGSH